MIVLQNNDSAENHLVEHHRFISEESISIRMRSFGETQSKTMRAYAQSGQYHISPRLS